MFQPALQKGGFSVYWHSMVVHMRHTRAHTANRRSHHALKAARFVVCQKCGAKHLMHRACGSCGTYRGRTVVDTLKKAVKAEDASKKKSKGKTAEKAEKE